jgi:hypothetical protein
VVITGTRVLVDATTWTRIAPNKDGVRLADRTTILGFGTATNLTHKSILTTMRHTLRSYSDRRAMMGSRDSSRRSLMSDKHFEG